MSFPARFFFQTRLMRAIFVGMYGQGVQIAVQLLGVPIMASSWGLDRYGVWLALYSVPSYLILADFGMTTAASNAMAMRMAEGNTEAARQLFHALRALVMIVVSILVCISVIVIYWPDSHLLDFADAATDGNAKMTCMILITYGLVGLSNGTVNAGFRAVDRYAFGGALYQSIFLIESIVLLIAVGLGAGLFHAALSVIIIRIAGSVLANVILRVQFSQFSRREGPLRFGELRWLLKPALGSMLLPFANATVLQGPVMLVASTLGAASVPIFTTSRTLTRLPLQLLMILSVATVSRFTVAHASDSSQLKSRLLLLNLVAALIILIPSGIVIMFVGPWVIERWTRGAVEPNHTLLIILALTMIANGFWMMLSNFLVAINRQDLFAFFFSFVALIVLLVVWLCAKTFGMDAIGYAVLFGDVLMLGWVSWQFVRLRLIQPALLFAEIRIFLTSRRSDQD